MYLSRIELDLSREKTMQALVSPNLFHGAIESAEKDGRSRKLWRVDTLGGKQYLLILSEKQLDFSAAAEQFGTGTYECKSYDGLLSRIENGTRWQFCLKANPTVQKYDTEKGRGKPIAHITPEFQMEWLKKQSEKKGFALEDNQWSVTGVKWYNFRKGEARHRVRLLAVTYEGTLTVTNAELFKSAMIGGIGR